MSIVSVRLVLMSLAVLQSYKVTSALPPLLCDLPVQAGLPPACPPLPDCTVLCRARGQSLSLRLRGDGFAGERGAHTASAFGGTAPSFPCPLQEALSRVRTADALQALSALPVGISSSTG